MRISLPGTPPGARPREVIEWVKPGVPPGDPTRSGGGGISWATLASDLPSSLGIRRATLRDIPLLVRHRRAMWEGIHPFPKALLDRGDRSYRRWLLRGLKTRRILGYLASSNRGGPVGSVTVWFRESEPTPGVNHVTAPFLSTAFVEPAYRRRGRFSAMVRQAVRECRSRGHAFVTGVPVGHARRGLRRLGFRSLGEMGLVLREVLR